MKKITFLLVILLHITCLGQISTDGLVAHWPLDFGLAEDASGNNYNGIAVDITSTSNRFDDPDLAMSFGGYVDFGNIFNEITAVQGAQFSISIWVKADDVTNLFGSIFGKYDFCSSTEQVQWSFNRSTGNVWGFQFSNTPNNEDWRWIIASTPLIPNTWHHIVINYDGTTNGNDGLDRVQLYMDNIMINTSLFTPTVGELGDQIAEGSAPLALGKFLDVNGDICGETGRFYNGALDDVRFYNRLLSLEDIDALFNEIPEILSVPELFLSKSIEVYSNLAVHPELKIYFKKPFNSVKIKLSNLLGEEIKTIDYNSISKYQEKSISVAELSSGMYIIRIQTDVGSFIKKILI